MIVYKLCILKKGEYYSFLKWDKYLLKYALNKKTIPIVGKIFCYNSIKEARNVKMSDDYYRDGRIILKCEGKKSKYQRKYIADICFSNDEEIANFWQVKKAKHRNHTPLGTIFMDWVIPISIVKRI